MSQEQPKLTFNTGPFDNVVVVGHASVEDYDREAGKVGACLEDADFNVIYRDTIPTIHDKAVKAIIEASGVTRGTNDKQTAKNQERENAAAEKAKREPKSVKPVEETFVDYAKRVKASVDEETWKTIDEKFRAVALATPVDASPAARQGSPSKANLAKAEEVLTRELDEIEATVTKLSDKVPGFDLSRESDGKPELNSLARLIGSYLNVLAEEQKKAL